MRVLIIEDIRFSAIVVEKFLKSKNYDYKCVASARDAIQVLEGDKEFDAIICDLFLPDMDGVNLFKACQQLKKFKKRGLPPFILITSSTNPQDLTRAETAGFMAAMVKPFDPVVLGEMLASIDDGQGYIQKDADKSKVIVVDNTGKNHELLQEVFANSGYRLMLAATPTACIGLLNEFTGIKAVITELEFTDMDANSLMGAIHNHPKCQGAQLPVGILLTESKNVDLVQMAYLSGFNDVLTYPIDKFNLKQKINNAFLNHGKRNTEQETILIVDDVSFYCTMAKTMLIKAGLDSNRYEIQTITSGYEALDILKSNTRIRMVLTDLMLKDMQGDQMYTLFLEQIQKNRLMGNPPSFVLMTAVDDTQQFEPFITQGFKEVFQKPLNVQALKTFLRKELEGKTPDDDDTEAVGLEAAHVD
jgi:CheY-like chemotaxis protein